MTTALSALRTFVRNQTLVESDDVSDANLNTMINGGLNELSLMFDWPFLQAEGTVTTVAGQINYSLPSNFRKMFVVRDEDRRATPTRLTFQQALNRWGGDPPTGGDASWYYLWNDDICLVPIPSDAESAEYRLYYQKGITELASDADIPEFASEFHLISAHYAIARVWEHQEDFPKSDSADQKFIAAAERMARYYHQRADLSPLIFGDGIRPSMFANNNMPFLDDAT